MHAPLMVQDEPRFQPSARCSPNVTESAPAAFLARASPTTTS